MRRVKEEALRWFDQASHDLEVAKSNLNAHYWSDTCFMCEQAAQKALKAYLIYHGKRYVWEHSIQELVKMCMEYEKRFKEFIKAGMTLDRFYIPTRYPNALAPPAVPYKSYAKEDALKAISLTERIIEKVREELKKANPV